MPKKNPKNSGGKSPFARALEKIRKNGLPRGKERMQRIRKLKSKGFDVDGFMKNTDLKKNRPENK